MIQREQSFI